MKSYDKINGCELFQGKEHKGKFTKLQENEEIYYLIELNEIGIVSQGFTYRNAQFMAKDAFGAMTEYKIPFKFSSESESEFTIKIL
jgi:hypothetical protein